MATRVGRDIWALLAEVGPSALLYFEMPVWDGEVCARCCKRGRPHLKWAFSWREQAISLGYMPAWGRFDRREAVSFYRRIGSPEPVHISMDDLDALDFVGCTACDDDCVSIVIGQADTWRLVRYVPIQESPVILVNPGDAIIWEHDHSCAGNGRCDEETFRGLYLVH